MILIRLNILCFLKIFSFFIFLHKTSGEPRQRQDFNSIPNFGSSQNLEALTNLVEPFPLSGASSAICRGVPGLTRAQLDVCQARPDVTLAALQGLQLAVDECKHQFKNNRWNCSSLATKSRNPHTSLLFQRGYRESAFAQAITAAGVAHSIARACSQGRLISCGCDPSSYRGSPRGKVTSPIKKTDKKEITSHWLWGGCSHNLQYGIEFSRMFLDAREKAGDIHSRISLHNNEVGRLVVANNMRVQCKCHGMSGSCEVKTCWKAAPDFRQVGKILKNRFRSALLADQPNLGNGAPLVFNRRERKRNPKNRNKLRKKPKKPRDLSTELLYYQKSPNFCEKDLSADIPGTFGRQCNKTSIGSDGCSSLCCGRGYNMVKRRRIERCHCKFHWCCHVECQQCIIEEWVPICN